jgi:uncharacterized membrane protein
MNRLHVPDAPKRRQIPLLLTAAVVALALCIRVHGLGRESLWLDEGFTWQRSQLPIREIIPNAIAAHHNPTYFVLLHGWMQLGDDEFMLRFPSALAGALAAGATCVLGWVLGGPIAGIVAGVLLAVAPLQVHFGQEARMYSALCATATTAAAAVFWFGTHPEAAARPIFGSRWLQRRWRRSGAGASQPSAASPPYRVWAAYQLGMLASLYLHNTSVIFAATLGVAVLAVCVHPFRQRIAFLINFVVASSVVLVGWGVYLRTELAQAERFSNENFWASFPTRKDLLGYLREIYVLTAAVPSTLSILLLAAAALGVVKLRKHPEVALAAVVFAALGPALMLLVSLYKPLFGTRLLLWVSPAFFALVGTGVARLRSTTFACAYLLAIGFLVRPQLARDYRELTNEPWRDVMSLIQTRSVPGARIITASFEEHTMFDYYMHRRTRPFAKIPVLIKKRREAWRLTIGSPRVWIVDRKSGTRFVRLKADLEARGVAAWDRRWNEQLRVVEFDLPRVANRGRASLN